jgi:steroid 5-alpha reductase family enzyme
MFYLPVLLLVFGSSYGFSKNRHDVADVMWSLWFISFTLSTASLFLDKLSIQSWILIGMIVLWGLRLSMHIGKRFSSKKSMDALYVKLLKHTGSVTKFFKVYILQALLAFVVLTPVTIYLMSGAQTNSWQFSIGLLIFTTGLIIETVSDWQLSSFLKSCKKGSVCNSGLWGWSRHPNYFGEVVLWFGIFIATLSNLSFTWTIVGPITITFLILKVSGVSMLEKHMQDNPKYAKYVESTPMFWPRKPNKPCKK